MSVRDERYLRYRAAAHAVASLLDERDLEQIAVLVGELPEGLAGIDGTPGVDAVVSEAQRPPRGADRAVRLLAEDFDLPAHRVGDATIALDDPVEARVPEPAVIRALSLAGELGPVFVRARTEDGRPVLGAWCAPWLAVERTAVNGKQRVRAWRTNAGLHGFVGVFELPRADASNIAGYPRPSEVGDLLAMADADAGQAPV
jgi:hypothetical protein